MTSSNRRVLVTGGTGFVGYWMRKTQPAGFDAHFLTRKVYETYRWQETKYDYIVHLAPISPCQVLKHAQGARVLFASSGAIYAGTDKYADNKRLWELTCRFAKNEVVIARLFSFIGPHLNRHAVHEFIDQAQHGGPIIIMGSGKAVRTYLYGEDLGRWMWKILLEGSGIYDVGGSVEYTILQVAQAVADCFPTLEPPMIETLNLPDIPETHYVPATARAEDLGCLETIGLQEAIRRTVQDA